MKEQSTIGTPLKGGSIGDNTDVLPYGERAKAIFGHIEDWSPGQLKNAVEVGEAKALRDPQGNTILHRAVETGNIALVDLLKNEYGFVGNFPNNQGVTAYDLAEKQGEEFVGVFGDMKPTEKAV